jgi:hypothetical protein
MQHIKQNAYSNDRFVFRCTALILGLNGRLDRGGVFRWAALQLLNVTHITPRLLRLASFRKKIIFFL